MIPDAVQIWLLENDYGVPKSTHPVSGGCINNGLILTTDSGKSFFLKINQHTPEDMFACEVEGLQALQVDEGPTVPKPYFHDSDFLLMEDLAPAARRSDYWSEFGYRMAALHQHTSHRFGFAHNNYIGSTSQPNPWTEDGYEFFGQHRLLYMARLAAKRGLLSKNDLKQVERLVNQLPDTVPQQPASLSHGDLWSGNALSNSGGGPAIIDPAAHYGWAEAELAMTTLFGSFPSAFYHAYEEERPLEPGYMSRFPIYNLYHLLNHLNIFGRGYLGQVQAILKRYA
jgi:protein-ribulosamine 3-kinase